MQAWTSIEGHFIRQLEIYRLRYRKRPCLILSRVTLIAYGVVSLTAVSAIALSLARPLLLGERQDGGRDTRGGGYRIRRDLSLFATEVGAIFRACPFSAVSSAGSNPVLCISAGLVPEGTCRI